MQLRGHFPCRLRPTKIKITYKQQVTKNQNKQTKRKKLNGSNSGIINSLTFLISG